MEKFYLTTTIPYVNAKAHLGHAQEFVYADIIVRREKSLGKEVFFNTGTDEHGIKNYRKAIEESKDPKAYVDEYAEKFKELLPKLGILPEAHFSRTTDKRHISAAQEFWKLCEKNDDIYKKNYKIKYCVGCELEKTDSELVNGRCPIHPNLELETIDEENYFFRFSKYQKPLIEFYDSHPDFVLSESRYKEIKQFVRDGLQDFSISRLKEKLPWGVSVPGDENHVMYVWFDALVNYISALDWPASAEATAGKPHSESRFNSYWGTLDKPNAIQIAGKDNLRQQSAMWQAMLLSAGLPNSKQIIIHGFINSGGQKMSKSLGNVADPYEILRKLQESGLSEQQAKDALRFYLAHEIPTFEDGDYTWEKLVESYNANLANGLGNLFERVFTLAAESDLADKIDPAVSGYIEEAEAGYYEAFLGHDLFEAIRTVSSLAKKLDKYVNEKEPWKLKVSDPGKNIIVLSSLMLSLDKIIKMMSPFMPDSAEVANDYSKKIRTKSILKNEKLGLFPRI